MVASFGHQGFSVLSRDDGTVAGMSSDGLGEVLFDSVVQAARWLGAEEGSLSLHHIDLKFEVGLSVHRRASSVSVMMEGVPDKPLFDQVMLSCSTNEFSRPDREAIWQTIAGATRLTLANCQFEFAYAITETVFEKLIRFSCVQQRVAEQHLPPFIPWMSIARAGTAIAHELEYVSTLSARPLNTDPGTCILQLTDAPWLEQDESVIQLSEMWRRVTRDEGCGTTRV